MKLTVKKSARDNSLIAELPECIGFFDKGCYDQLVLGNEYEFIITGYTNKLNPHTGFPSAVFLDLVQEADRLLNVPVFETSGSMCRTTTYHPDVGMIFPSKSRAILAVDNVSCSFHKLPYIPTPHINMWVRKSERGLRGIGVDSYKELAPVMLALPEIRSVMHLHSEFHRVHRLFFSNDIIDGLKMAEALDLIRRGNLLTSPGFLPTVEEV